MNPKTEEALRLAREALEAVEEVFNADEETECAWCRVEPKPKSERWNAKWVITHKSDCLRQRALAAIDALDASDTPPSQAPKAS